MSCKFDSFLQMIEEFKAFIASQHLFSDQDSIMLALSGGIDSVVMADLFARSGYSFAIAHCNFSLRGDESVADEIFVRSLADKYGVACFVQQFDTIEESIQTGESVQMVARRLRYVWFSSLLQEENYQYVATAHQKNDVLETMLFNLSKGSGIAGLHGIPVKTKEIIRPLLFAERRAIEHYAHQQGLSWRDDMSNFSMKYARNLIRHEVIPHLLQINPNLFNTLDDTLERLQGAEKAFQQYVAQVEGNCMEIKGESIFLSLSVLQSVEALPVVLSEMLKPFGFQYGQARAIAGRIQQESSGAVGKIYRSKNYILNIDREHIILSPAVPESLPVYYLDKQSDHLTIEGYFTLNFCVWQAQDFTLDTDPAVAALDFERLHFPLQVRKWKAGDWFQPLGMKGKKKLSDFMIDHKIPLNLKNRIFVLTSGEAIVWVIGYRIDNRFKITGATRQVFQIIQENKL